MAGRIIGIVTILGALLLGYFPTSLVAATAYTAADVAEHSTSSDCWVIFGDGVYDLTDYLPLHDRYLDIRSWCGDDMTEDFATKAGRGVDHRTSSYYLLENYRIGSFTQGTGLDGSTSAADSAEGGVDTSQLSGETSSAADDSGKSGSSNPYNFWLPFLATLIVYMLTYGGMRSAWGQNRFPRPLFNLLWNTLLFISLIPSAVFGCYLIFSYSIPALAAVNFNFLYWHVEGSVVFATIVFAHFILRYRQYLGPFRLLNKT